MPISINSNAIKSLVACAHASDKERTSPTLVGVSLTLHPADGITIAATDGKVLCEHQIPASDAYPGGIASFPDSLAIILADGPTLGKRLKPLLPGAKAKPYALTLTIERKSLTLTGPTGAVTLALIEGIYANYRQALDNIIAPPSYGLNADYLSRLGDLLETSATRQGVIMREGRGLVFERLGSNDLVKRRALIMPVSAPGVEPMVKMTKAELDALCAKANAPRDPSGEVSKAIEDYKREHPPGAAEECQRQITHLESEVARLSKLVADAEQALADHRAKAGDISRKPEKSTTTVVRWSPTAQSKQLQAVGLTVDNLRQAGFRWVPADQAWESLDPAAQEVIDRILAA